MEGSREFLFPNYTLGRTNQQHRFSRQFFKGTVPLNWRVYKTGSKLLFGADTFAPLHWYWSYLQ